MKNGIKMILFLILCALILPNMMPTSVSADMGPKPSVRITFINMGEDLCYGTLLSESSSTGPSSVWNGEDEAAYHNGNEYFPNAPLDYSIWKALVDYEDADGYHFLQHSSWKVSETKEINWNYYPPQKFKILLYYPESEKFVVSGIYERYAFDSYFTVNMEGISFGSVDYDEDMSNNDTLEAYKSYEWQAEILSFLARVLITVAIEMGVALLFGFRSKKAIKLLIVVNSVTQVVLNILLNIINFSLGEWAFVFGYVMLELAVFVIEAVLYALLRSRVSDKPRRASFYFMYAAIANLVSFVAGFGIAIIVPGIF